MLLVCIQQGWSCLVFVLALMSLLAMPFCNLGFAVVLGTLGNFFLLLAGVETLFSGRLIPAAVQG